MGMLADCEAMGIPGHLLLPVLPWNAGWSKRGKSSNPNGKSPARMDPVKGHWVGLLKWEHGCPENERLISDEWNCNVGLLLGQERDGYVFAVLDGDLTADSLGINEQVRPYLLKRLAIAFGVAGLLVRETVKPRFMVLVRLDPKGNAGGRQTITLDYHSEEGSTLSLGKLELLTKGEHAVIAGTHQSGNPMVWTNTAAPTREYRAPKIDEGLPIFPSFEAFSNTVIAALKPLEKGHIFATVNSTAARAYVGASRDPVDLAPPQGAVDFCRLIDLMPNPMSIDYDGYIQFWYALEGCRRSLRALKRLTPEDDHEMVRAGLDWSMRWELPPGKEMAPRTAHMEKFRYISAAPNVSLGWGFMCVFAGRCGYTEIGLEEAQHQFEADLDLPPPEKRRKPVDPDPDKRQPLTALTPDDLAPTAENKRALLPGFRSVPKKFIPSLDVPLSDIQIADQLELELSGRMIWIADEKRWMTYENGRGWSADDAAGSRVEIEVEDLLRAYTARWADAAPAAGEKWTRGERTGAMSTTRVTHVLKRLATRFAKPRIETDQGRFVLQTPDGAIDLRTGDPLNELQQKLLLDTRCTNFGVGEGETPLFDELIRNLSDGDPGVVNYFLHYLGYALLGWPKIRVFLFVWGTTGNGKSALVRVLKRIFGTYVVVLNNDVLLERGKELHKTDLYRIRGARLACAVEMPANEKWDDTLIKALTGGDEISARPMHTNAKSFTPDAVLLMAGNNIPAFDRVDQAIAARARITGTTYRPPVEDSSFEDRMVEGEGGAIVAKLGGYAQAVYKAGMKLPATPEIMARKTRLYLGEQDVFFAWVTAELNIGHSQRNAEVPILELKKRFEFYVKREAEQSGDAMIADKVSDKVFVGHLRTIGLKLESDNDGSKLHRVIIANGKKMNERIARGCSFKVRAVASA